MPVLDDLHRERIAGIVSEVLEINKEEMTDHSLFKDDHGADSLRAIEILAALERTFNVEIDQAELSRMVNLHGIYEVVSEATQRPS
jgi:acyl carrier protein